jgi:hypothetical protein
MNKQLALLLCLSAACGTKPAPTDDPAGLAIGEDDKADLPAYIRLIGSIDYGQTRSGSYYNPPRYRAFKFAGEKGDKVTIDVGSNTGDAVTWLLDDGGRVLAYNDDHGGSLDSHIAATLPGNRNPAIVTYYIVFREYSHRAATFKVRLEGPAKDLYACNVDADCVKVRAGCCPHQGWTAVASGLEDEFRDTLGCAVNPICPRIAERPDYRVAQCNFSTKKCELMHPEAIDCGGHSLNPHDCPAGWSCRGDALAYDGTGKCHQSCGGFAGFQCGRDGGTSAADACVDDPHDSCDPQAGGADCPGFCHRCGDVQFRCTHGVDWLNCRCNDPPADCRVTGCGPGSYCSFCWGNYACIPNGAVC